MLEPITTALIAGAAAGVGGAATQVVTDAYNGLKNFIVSKFSKTKAVIEVLEGDPEDEDTRKIVIKKLDEAKIGDDPDVQRLAAALTTVLKSQGLLPAGSTIHQTATGDGNVQIAGNANSVTSNVSKGNSGISLQGSTVHGSVTQGDTVAGDKFTGDKVMGDKVAGDKIGTQINNFSTAPELKSINSADARALVPLLNESFLLSDIDSLCFEMGIDEEQLRGQTKDEKARSLVKFVEQNERLPKLKRLMRMARPNLRDRLK